MQLAICRVSVLLIRYSLNGRLTDSTNVAHIPIGFKPQTEFRLVQNQSEYGKYNLIPVESTRLRSIDLGVRYKYVCKFFLNKSHVSEYGIYCSILK